MNNLDLYNKVRTVPPEAQRTITGGRLNGKTDINPMWRIQTLTEHFGQCGNGWKYEITKMFSEPCSDGEVMCFVEIGLRYKVGDEWSEPVVGIGGSKLVENSKNGLYNNDEGYKMALTDAISVACKALGFGADIYWQGGSKYSGAKTPAPSVKPAPSGKFANGTLTPEQAASVVIPFGKHENKTLKQIYSEDKTYFKWLLGADDVSANIKNAAIVMYEAVKAAKANTGEPIKVTMDELSA